MFKWLAVLELTLTEIQYAWQLWIWLASLSLPPCHWSHYQKEKTDTDPITRRKRRRVSGRNKYIKSLQWKLYEAPNLSVKAATKTKAQRRTEVLVHTFTDTLDSMLLLPIWLVIVDLCGITAAFYSLTGSREVFHVHPTPQMWNASDSTVINGNKFFPLFCQLWKNSRFGAVSTNGSKWDLGYALADVCWEGNEGCHLENCQAVSRKGKPNNMSFFRAKLRVGKFFYALYFYNQQHSKRKIVREHMRVTCSLYVAIKVEWLYFTFVLCRRMVKL